MPEQTTEVNMDLECPRCGTDYGPGNHRCNLTDGSTLCYECTLDLHPPMAQTERERLSDWLSEMRAGQIERGLSA